MRIISGSHKGRRIATEIVDGLRPSSDKLRGGVFSALCARRELEGCRVLDLYAGTGAFGMEALSRGARHATFIEAKKKLVSGLRENLQSLELADRSRIISGELPGILSTLRGQDPFDVIFADAPYDVDVSYLGKALHDLGAVVPGSDLLVETSKRTAPLPAEKDGVPMHLLRELKYGDSLVRWYEYLAPSEAL